MVKMNKEGCEKLSLLLNFLIFCSKDLQKYSPHIDIKTITNATQVYIYIYITSLLNLDVQQLLAEKSIH